MLDKKSKIIVTGGAGFIGSCIIRTLNDKGYNEIYIVDHIAETEKWKNIRNKNYIDYIPREEFLQRLEAGEFDDVSAFIHMGACSSTTEKDFDYLWKNNVQFSKRIWAFCSEKGIQLIYASSAATYGDGILGFSDSMIDGLLPLNGYGYSKLAFDKWTGNQKSRPKQAVGLRFFNVYGPNEYYKGSMASMVFHGFGQIKESGQIRLFKSYNEKYPDGGQLRDFVYVKDVCKVIMHFLDNPDKEGIFNVGTGKAQSFAELAGAVFNALGINDNIRYIDMPEYLKEKYQYYTQADISKLKEAGYNEPFSDLNEGVLDYVKNHLSRNYENY